MISDLQSRARSLLDLGTPHTIAGVSVGGEGEDLLAVVDPSTEDVLGELRSASPKQVDDAVRAAAIAQPGWNEIGPFERMRVLHGLADALRDYVDELAELEALDSGNPLKAMRDDVRIGIDSLQFLAALGVSLQGTTIPSQPHRLHYTLMQPFGVVGRILPFNHPAMFFISKSAAPLIAGNSLVIKPPDQAPLTAIRLAEIFQEHLPAGVLNVVQGGPATGEALVTHPDVKRLAFTGSMETGKRIQAAGASVGIKSVSLELGGKNPMIVLPDADLGPAVEAAVTGMNLTVCQGQSCGSNSRIFVHDSMRDEYIESLSERLSRINVGVAYDQDTEMGPLVSSAQYARVQGYISSAREDGVRIAYGGGRPTNVPHEGGYFVEPTLLVDPASSTRVATEEIFGPVVSVFGWTDLESVIQEANRVEYGLTASVWTRDVDDAHRIAHDLDAGYVWINQHGPHYPGTPFGGLKASGTAREESFEEILSYCEQKTVHLEFRSSRGV